MANIVQQWLLNIKLKGDKLVLQANEKMKASLQQTQQAASGAASGVRKVASASAHHFKQSKGVANATTNQTKAFSKMEQGMVGGLVPAYATVAANIFALTAAFGALSRAADFQVLIAGAESLSVQTGRNLISLAGSMQAVTDSAITMKEALTSASIAASAGFDNETILELTQVARNASIALGRDMTDAMNRVFKGAVKAEPELLDELGIILRLDPATRKYAASIGKAVSELTTFEKQQAVVNEVIQQGNDKFSKLSEIDVSPFSQLSAQFLSATNSILGFANVGLGPIISLITDNMYLLISSMALFGNTILRSAIPALQKLSGEVSQGLTNAFTRLGDKLESQDIAVEFFETMKSELTDLDSVFDQTGTNLENSLDIFGDDLPKDFFANIQKDMGSLNEPAERVSKALHSVKSAMADLEKEGVGSEGFEKKRRSLIGLQGALEGYQIGLHQVRGETEKLNKATDVSTGVFERFNNGLKLNKLAIMNGFLAGTSSGFSGLIQKTYEFSAGLERSEKQGVKFNRILRGMSTSLFLVSGLIGSVVKAIPYIGLVTFAFGLLKAGVDKLFAVFRTNNEEILLLGEAYDSLNDSIETTLKTAINFEIALQNLPNTLDNINKKLTAQSNILNTLTSGLESVLAQQDTLGGFSAWDQFLDTLFELDGLGGAGGFGNLDKLKDETIPGLANVIKHLGIKEAKFEVEDLIDSFGGVHAIMNLSASAATRLGIQMLELFKKTRDLKNEQKDANDALIENVDQLSKAFDSLATGKLSDVEKVFVNLNELLAGLDPTNVEQVASALTGLSTATVLGLGIEDTVDSITEYNVKLEESEEALENIGTQQRLNALSIAENTEEQEAGFTSLFKNTKLLEAENKKLIDTQLELTAEMVVQQQIRFDSISAITTFNAIALKALDEQLDYYRELVDAQRQYNLGLARLKFDAAAPGADIEKRISLINEETKLQVHLNDLNRTANENILAKLKARQGRFATDKDKGTDPNSLNAEILKVETKLETTRTANANSYLKQLSSIEKALVETSKREGLGINVDITGDEILESQIIPTIRRLAVELGKSEEEIQANIVAYKSLQEFTKLEAATGGTSAAGVAGDTLSLADKVAAFQAESEYLRVNNELIDQRIDKEFLLAGAKAESDLKATEAALALNVLQGKHDEEKTAQAQELRDFIKANNEAATAFVISQIEQDTKRGQITLANRRAELSLGLNITKTQKIQLNLAKQKAILDAQNIDKSTKAYKTQLKVLQKLAKQEIQFDLQSDIGDILGPLREFSDILTEMQDRMEGLSDKTEKTAAAFVAMFEAGEAGDNDTIKALAQAGLSVTQFQEDFKNAGFDGEKIWKSWTDLAQGFGGAMSDAFEEGSAASEAFKVIQLAGAVVDGVRAVIASGQGIPFPYNIAAMAATAAVVVAQLSSIGASGTPVSGAGGGPSAAEEYNESFGDNRIQGVDMQSNALVDSIDQLMEVDANLFSATRDLQLSVVKLKDSFDRVGASLFRAGGGFEVGDVTDIFGVTFGTEFDGGFFTDTTTETELLNAGIQFGVTIREGVDGLTASIVDAALYAKVQITETSNSWFGGDTDIDLDDVFLGLDPGLEDDINDALNESLAFLGNTLTSFGADTETIFRDFALDIDVTKINLTGLAADEQSEAIAGFISHVGNEVLRKTTPWLTEFDRAGEELLDTLIRLTAQSLELNNTLATTGDTTADLAGINNTGITDAAKAIFDEQTAFFAGRNSYLTGIKTEAEAARSYLTNLFASTSEEFKTWSIFETLRNIAPSLIKNLNSIQPLFSGSINNNAERPNLVNFFTGTIDNLDAEIAKLDDPGAWKPFLDKIVKAWETELLTYYEDTAEFNKIFQQFAETVFSTEDLAQIAEDNAKLAITGGITELLPQLGGMSTEILDLANSLTASTDSALDVGKLFNLLKDASAFVGDEGVLLYSTLVDLGYEFGNLETVVEESTSALDDFNKGIERQIAVFGLAGKELDLLELDFSFEDALEEAREVGGDIAQVEILYGLRRVEIITQYNQDIVDSIESTRDSIANAVRNIDRELGNFDEVGFQTEKLKDLWEQLLQIPDIDTDNAASSIVDQLLADIPNNLASNSSLQEISAFLIDLANDTQIALNQIDLDEISLPEDIERLKREVFEIGTLGYYIDQAIAQGRNISSSQLSGVTQHLYTIEDEIMEAFISIAEGDYTGTLNQALTTLYADVNAIDIAKSAEYETIKARFAGLFDLKAILIDAAKNVTIAQKKLALIGSVIDIEEFTDPILNLYQDIIALGETNIPEQIELINEVRDATLARYEAEKAQIESITQLTIDIKGFIDDLFLSDISPLIGSERLALAQSQFQENLAQASSEDPAIAEAARSGLLESAQVLLDLGSNLFGIGPQFQSIFDNVVDSLTALGIELGGDQDTDSILTELAETTKEELGILDGMLTILEAEQASTFQSEMLLATLEMDASIVTGITEKLESLSTEIWGPTLTALRSIDASLGGVTGMAAGDSNVQFDQLAVVHQGEMIIPEANAEMLRSGDASIGTEFPTYDNSDVVAAIGILTQVVADSQEDILDSQQEQLTATEGLSDHINIPAVNTRNVV